MTTPVESGTGSLLTSFLLGESAPQDDAAFKACCAYLYEHPAVRWLLGESYHPGGEALTRHLGQALGLSSSSLVLDVATGPGDTLRVLSESFGSRAVGLDLGALLPLSLQGGAAGDGQRSFARGDAESIPFADNTFDAIVCECSFCLLPDKPRAAAEFRRVLRSGGRLGISDVTLAAGAAVDRFRNVIGWIACVADARPSEEYGSLLETAGLRLMCVEDQTPALARTISEVRKKLFMLRVAAKAGQIKLGMGGDAEAAAALSLADKLVTEAMDLTKQAQSMVQEGALGYCLLVAEKA